MHRRLLRWMLALLHLAFWIGVVFVFVCILGSLRWLKPGLNPTADDLAAFGYAVLAALGLYTVFYVYDTFWGEREKPAWDTGQDSDSVALKRSSRGEAGSREGSVERAMGIEPTS